MNLIQALKKKLSEINAFIELKIKAGELKRDSVGLSSRGLIELLNGKWKKFFWLKQVNSEILTLCEIVERKKPEVVVEIGTANGGSLFLFTKLSAKNALIISIDLPGGSFGGAYPWYRKAFYKSFSSGDQKVKLLLADSHSNNTVEKLKNILNGKKIDFLFIDGDHTYEGVKKDFNLYQSLVDDDGIIAFHDIAKHPRDWGVEVDKFWNEIKQSYQSLEIIENPDQGWAGIGILYKHKNER